MISDTFFDDYILTLLWKILLTIVMIILLIKLLQWLFTDTTFPIPDVSKQHNWHDISLLGKVCYCALCEALMISGLGFYCDCCGVCADQPCIKKADRKLPCKVVTSQNEITHHWVKGNLSPAAVCDICFEDCSIEPGLTDYQCCWCQRTVHKACKVTIANNICDMGPWRRLIVPPWTVRVSGRKTTVRRHQHIQSVVHPGWPDWMPLIIIGNRKSGNSDCEKILSHFRRFLNPVQIVDLEEKPPIIALQWGPLLGTALSQGPIPVNRDKERKSDNQMPNTEMIPRILVAGGDGTVAWILNVIHNMGIKPAPAVGILPLGTGNDLSRILGWGKSTSANLDPGTVMQQVLHSTPIALDRWLIDIQPYRHLGLRLPARSMYMYNYLSVGVDAQVALNFHRTRNSRFYLFSNRIFNKLLYLLFGTHEALAANCQNIQDRLELYMDGLRVELPSIESIVILNIPSWGAGVSLWSMGNDEEIPEQSINDGKLEVCAIYSSFHIAQLQVGMSQPHRFGQAKVVEIKINGSCPVQIDGEPWEQHPAHITITHKNQATMLKWED